MYVHVVTDTPPLGREPIKGHFYFKTPHPPLPHMFRLTRAHSWSPEIPDANTQPQHVQASAMPQRGQPKHPRAVDISHAKQQLALACSCCLSPSSPISLALSLERPSIFLASIAFTEWCAMPAREKWYSHSSTSCRIPRISCVPPLDCKITVRWKPTHKHQNDQPA